MKNPFFVLCFLWSITSFYGQVSSMNVIGSNSLTSCDSILNFSIYNVQAPANMSGDFNLVTNNINSGSYALAVSVDWGDGTTSAYQGTENRIIQPTWFLLTHPCNTSILQWGLTR